MLQPIFETQDILPGPSSQTTTVWPWVRQMGDEEATAHGLGYSIGSPRIQAPKAQSRGDLIEEILGEYSEVWNRLANL